MPGSQVSGCRETLQSDQRDTSSLDTTLDESSLDKDVHGESRDYCREVVWVPGIPQWEACR